MKYRVNSRSLKDTQEFGEAFGERLKGGEIIQLVGDVGAGKTTFVRSIAKGAGSSDHVSSPTFTICNTYRGRVDIRHCDFYRLHDDALIERELEELVDSGDVVILEWAENIKTPGAKESIVISIASDKEDFRTFDISASDKYNYLEL